MDETESVHQAAAEAKKAQERKLKGLEDKQAERCPVRDSNASFRNGRNLRLCSSMFVRSTATWRTRAGSVCPGGSSATQARRTASRAPRASATTLSASVAATPSSSRAAAAPTPASSAYVASATNRQKNATQPRQCLRRVGVPASSTRFFRTSSRRACLRFTPSSTARSVRRESYPWSTTVRTKPLVSRG